MREIDPQSGDLKSDARLGEALRELAVSSRQSAAPEVGAGLAMAFRRHHARRRLVRWVGVAALAACLALVGSLLSMHSRHEVPAKETVKGQPSVVPVKAPEAITIAKAVTMPSQTVKKHVKPKASNNMTASRRQFRALPGYDPAIPAEQLSIVRVQLPASALWQMGAPVSPDSGARKFMADFVVSQDGTPYAVRLVQ